MSPEFQPSSLQPCVQPECAQTGSVIPCCICVFSLHRAVAGKVPKTCPGHSLSPVPHPRPCRALWSSAQTPHRPRRLSAPVAASLEGRAGQVLANYRVNDQLGTPEVMTSWESSELMTSWESPAQLYPAGALSASPGAGRVCWVRAVPSGGHGTAFGAPAMRRGSRRAPAPAWRGRCTLRCAGCSVRRGFWGDRGVAPALLYVGIPEGCAGVVR